MAIPVILDKAAPYSLGGAHFYTDVRIASERCIAVNAETSRSCPRPIDLHVSADGHRSLLSLSEDEAEALIACLQRAVSLRREADQSQAA